MAQFIKHFIRCTQFVNISGTALTNICNNFVSSGFQAAVPSQSTQTWVGALRAAVRLSVTKFTLRGNDPELFFLFVDINS
jgi:hypothetical protein